MACPAQIIVLDTDVETGRIVERLLVSRGFSVAVTDDPREAAVLARVAMTELVLADLAMGAVEAVPRWARRRDDPEQLVAPRDAYAVLRSPARDPVAGRFPLAVLRDGGNEDGHAQRFGIVDVVPKPIDGNLLRLKVASALADEAPAPSDAHPRAAGEERPPRLAFEAIPRSLRTAVVVDSDAGFRRWIRGLMAIHGFMVHEAETGEEGLARIVGERPFLVLSELHLRGGLDGAELCRRVRRSTLTARLPLLLLSTDDDYAQRHRGLRAGADDFVSKRVTARELLIRIQLTLERHADPGGRMARGGAAMEGRIELIGMPGLLQTCHLGQLSGVLTVRAIERAAEIHFRNGEIIAARTAGDSGADAVHELLGWPEGRFEFSPREMVPQTPLVERFEKLLLDGCHRLDEARRSAASSAS